MSVSNRLSKLIRLGPKAIAIKGSRKIRGAVIAAVLHARDAVISTYAAPTATSASLISYIRKNDLSIDSPLTAIINEKLPDLIEHRFDLLGSGKRQLALSESMPSWIDQNINRANIRSSQRVAMAISPGYSPIDWHTDFISGHTWEADCWYRRISVHSPGQADIKVPWELSRMQHLFALALGYAVSTVDHEADINSEKYIAEFQNQVLDFIAANPPRHGVNWACTMDVSIRVVNWLLAFDVFKAFGAEFSLAFERTLQTSVLEHGHHIINNLEWHPEQRNNHYLANIVGLIFCAAYLPSSPQTDIWLSFAAHELVDEASFQFNPDGSSFEASTCYHRLSAEMLLVATALILGLPQEKRSIITDTNTNTALKVRRLRRRIGRKYSANKPFGFPDWYFERLEKMVEFTIEITKASGNVAQIGDNDNGRLIRPYDPQTSDGNVNFLDHAQLIAMGSGLFERPDFRELATGNEFYSQLVRALANGYQHPSYRGEGQDTHESTHEKTTLQAFSDFGLYIYRSRDWMLCIRCGSTGQNGVGGHAHNDQLSIEFSSHGIDWIVDTGSYTYTAKPEYRNYFRSTAAHSTVRVDACDQSSLEDVHLFTMNDPQAVCTETSETHFVGEHRGYLRLKDPVIHRRTVQVLGCSGRDGLRIRDFLDGIGDHYVECFFHTPCEQSEVKGNTVVITQGEQQLRIHHDSDHPLVPDIREALISPSYGVYHVSKVITFRGTVRLPTEISFQFETIAALRV